MTNIKYSKRFKLRNGERVDFCPECDYHITDTVNKLMRLIDADKAKAELLRLARDIHDCCGFYDGLKAGYQSAADRLDTIPTAEKECDKGHWIDITFDASMCSVCQTTQEYETKYCPECGAKMDGDNNVK